MAAYRRPEPEPLQVVALQPTTTLPDFQEQWDEMLSALYGRLGIPAALVGSLSDSRRAEVEAALQQWNTTLWGPNRA